MRDQIKTWVASNDIKDKSALLENRRLIETVSSFLNSRQTTSPRVHIAAGERLDTRALISFTRTSAVCMMTF